ADAVRAGGCGNPGGRRRSSVWGAIVSGATLPAGELWLLIIVLSGAAYALKVLGFVVVGGRTMPPVLNRCLALIPASLLAALVAKDTFTTAQELVLDARAVGLVVAIVAVWRKAPFIVVVVVAMAATALVRALA
ncbi:MAG: AzlD domain-containing protein, partial [Ilumatobacteraceae bacterium]